MSQLQQQTRSHYNQYPFIEGGANRVAWWRDYLREFLPDELIRNRLIVDVGSSVGEITRGLIDRGARMACLDVSDDSLRRCRAINPEADVLHGTALELPFPDAAFDHAISIGVLHHTPDCRRGFRELARVTAPGGVVLVFLYNFWSIYNPIYRMFAPVRAVAPLRRVPRWLLYSLQPFARAHLGQSLDETQLRNLLGDKLWTPQATFHSVSQVRRWGREEGLELTGFKRFYLGYANVMRFVKQGSGNDERRELQVRGTRNGDGLMRRGDTSYTCEQCDRSYPVEGGIIRCLAK